MDLEQLLRNAAASRDQLLRHLDRSDLARQLGLARGRRWDDALDAIGLFGAGVIVGAGLALLLAPRSGRELRERIGTRVAHGLRREEEHAGDTLQRS
jgi:hypothetical protein